MPTCSRCGGLMTDWLDGDQICVSCGYVRYPAREAMKALLGEGLVQEVAPFVILGDVTCPRCQQRVCLLPLQKGDRLICRDGLPRLAKKGVRRARKGTDNGQKTKEH